MPKSFGLGRGLGSLIPQNAHTNDDDVKLSDKERVFWVPPSEVEANPFQPRRDFGEEDLQDLMDSIREHGILQPIVVTRLMDGKYQLIAGERRLRAAEKLKLQKIPVIVREANNQDKLVLALIENIQRSNLNPIEEARAYKQLADEFHFSHIEIGEKTGKSRPVISNTIRLLNLPEEIQKGLGEGKITYSEARTILSLPTEESQLEYYRKRLSGETGGGNIEMSVKRFGGASRAPKHDAEAQMYEDRLREHLNTKVEVVNRGVTQKIVIHFYDRDQLGKIVQKILE